jgi:hypothetical protein
MFDKTCIKENIYVLRFDNKKSPDQRPELLNINNEQLLISETVNFKFHQITKVIHTRYNNQSKES